MTADREITIFGRVYRRNPEVDRYQIHLDELEGLEMREIPTHSHLKILGLPEPKGVCSIEVFGLNAGPSRCPFPPLCSGRTRGTKPTASRRLSPALGSHFNHEERYCGGICFFNYSGRPYTTVCLVPVRVTNESVRLITGCRSAAAERDCSAFWRPRPQWYCNNGR